MKRMNPTNREDYNIPNEIANMMLAKARRSSCDHLGDSHICGKHGVKVDLQHPATNSSRIGTATQGKQHKRPQPRIDHSHCQSIFEP